MAVSTNDVANTPLNSFPTDLSLVWLDAQANEYRHFKRTYSKLLHTDECSWSYYKDKTGFLNAFNSIELPKKIILITSGSLGTEIMQEINDLKQLQCAYIYCQNIEKYKSLQESHRKIVGIHKTQPALYKALREELDLPPAEEPEPPKPPTPEDPKPPTPEPPNPPTPEPSKPSTPEPAKPPTSEPPKPSTPEDQKSDIKLDSPRTNESNLDLQQYAVSTDVTNKLIDSKINNRSQSPSLSGNMATDKINVPTTTDSDDESNFEFPEELKRGKAWKYVRGLNTTETGQGDVYLIKKRYDSTEAALKIYKRADNRNKRMRSHREMKALRTMADRGMNMPSNIISLIDTNIPDLVEQAVQNKKILWIIASLARGISLAEYRKMYPAQEIGLHEAVIFCLKLLHIVKSFHTCGIVHRDIKPDNIHIDLQKDESLEKGHITVLDFGLACIKESTTADDAEFEEFEIKQSNNPYATDLCDKLGNIWYRVPQLFPQKTAGLTKIQKEQLKQQRRSPSIDASSICAFLYWFLTKEIPGEYYVNQELPPHRELLKNTPDYWNNVVQKAIETSGSKCDRSRLHRYLLHVFDRGFAAPAHQWAMDQLLQHLNIMHNWLHNDTVFSKEWFNLPAIPTLSITSSFLNAAFQPAAALFQAAKIDFVKNFPSEGKGYYHWNTDKNIFHWIDGIAIDQRTNVDLLQYYSPPGTLWTLQIYSLAKIDEENNINLFVGGIIDDVDIRLPVYTLPSNQAPFESEYAQQEYEQHKKRCNKIYAEELDTLINLFLHTPSH